MTEPTDPGIPQPLVGFMANEEWDELLGQVNDLVGEMERIPLPEVRDKVFALLAGIDAIHREALRRLVRLFKEGVLEKVVTDPAIHTLMELYDLLPPDALRATEGDAAAGKAPRLAGIPIKVVNAAASPAPPPAAFPRWVPVLREPEAPAPGSARVLEADDRQVLLCRVADRLFALDAHCLQDGSSLEGARIEALTLCCPNHPGCLYDVRQGSRIGRGGQLACYPVRREEDGRIWVGLDMPFQPDLPSF